MRVRALDGLRGVAILLVMLYHQTVMASDAAIDRFFTFWSLSGWIGVDLFFVLSGFLITGILYDAKGSHGYFRNFYARRVLRIFPLYYAVVAFSLLILPHIPHWKLDNLARIQGDELWYWSYLSNFSIAAHSAFRHGILDVSWSLAIEEQFYLTWPLVVLLLGRRTLIGLCCTVFVFALAWRGVLLGFGVAPLAVGVLTPGRLDPLATGACIALVARGSSALQPLARLAPLAMVASLGVVLAIGIATGGVQPYSLAMLTVGYSALALLFGSILVLTLTAAHSSRRVRLLEQPTLVALGKYSYALYLFHLPIRAVIRDRFYGPDQFFTVVGSSLPGQVVFYLLASLATFGAAWVSWHVFESHFLRLKRYFVATPTPTIVVPPTTRMPDLVKEAPTL
jgi:peptidoglycan/LPS O-acetylase OafA/YrhL